MVILMMTPNPVKKIRPARGAHLGEGPRESPTEEAFIRVLFPPTSPLLEFLDVILHAFPVELAPVCRCGSRANPTNRGPVLHTPQSGHA